MKPTIVGLVAVAACFSVFGGVSPASAQVDLSGMWAPIFHEDQIERAQVGQAAANSAQIIAHENVMKRMTEPEGNAKPATGLMLPTDTFFTEESELFFNGEAVQILHQPDAHTDGEGGTYVIPGHGRLTDEADVVEDRDMMTIIRDRLADAEKKGRTLEQVKAAGLLRDYEKRYGAAQGAWTTDKFLEAAYQSLKENK